jgi:tetratricopeptide (TPR) repeat protein
MLTIYAATKYHNWLHEVIVREDRLDELIDVVDYLDHRPVASAHSLVVRDEAIFPVLDWYDILPPYLLAEKFDLRPENVLGLVFARLDNYERVYHYLAGTDPSLTAELDIYNRLRHGLTIDAGDLASSLDYYGEYRLMHNQAIVRHYGGVAGDAEQTKYYYLQALETAPSGEHRAFSCRHFAQLLIDLGEEADAARVLAVGRASAESEEGKTALRHTYAQHRLRHLRPPYEAAALDELKGELSDALSAYEKQGRPLATALALLDAAMVAQANENWTEALGCINRAITLLGDTDTPALLADAYLRKGTLFYQWGQAGSPHFYAQGADPLRRAAKIFTREEAPLIYADIQQRLGLLYAVMPDEEKKRGMWAAVSSTAFQEALSVLDPDRHPREYAEACNHYGNALLQYPAAKLTDNAEKALYYYQEALDRRPAESQPRERALTLLNHLEAQWHLGMAEDRFDERRYHQMVAHAEEVIQLSPDPALAETAREHLTKLGHLRAAYAQAHA